MPTNAKNFGYFHCVEIDIQQGCRTPPITANNKICLQLTFSFFFLCTSDQPQTNAASETNSKRTCSELPVPHPFHFQVIPKHLKPGSARTLATAEEKRGDRHRGAQQRGRRAGQAAARGRPDMQRPCYNVTWALGWWDGEGLAWEGGRGSTQRGPVAVSLAVGRGPCPYFAHASTNCTQQLKPHFSVACESAGKNPFVHWPMKQQITN